MSTAEVELVWLKIKYSLLTWIYFSMLRLCSIVRTRSMSCLMGIFIRLLVGCLQTSNLTDWALFPRNQHFSMSHCECVVSLTSDRCTDLYRWGPCCELNARICKKNWISIVNQDLCQAVVTEQRVFLSTALQGVELEGGTNAAFLCAAMQWCPLSVLASLLRAGPVAVEVQPGQLETGLWVAQGDGIGKQSSC